MGVLLVVIVAVLLLGGLITGYISARRRSSGEGYLEPPRARGVKTIDLDELEPNEPSSGVGVVVPEPDEATVAEIEEALGAAVEEVQEEAVRPRFRDRLGRARSTIAGYLGSIVSRSGIDDATWAERTGADFVRGAEGGDPSSVIFDAVQRAASRNADLVLADTAGRLHTKVNLMEELRKVRRVAGREPGNVTEVLLVLDATTGQNGLTQAKEFLDAVEVTGVVLTKL